uniref:LRRCT domain-containing protein n=1 Tax=Panagrellus redivivus TaxID=6233 RepID=A0A7E4W5Z6_PANRE
MLESVDLSHNALRDIEFLKPIEQMVYILDLSHNFYTNISMSNYYELNSLDLSYNLLRKESAIELNKIPNLMNLFLKGNAFSSMNVLNLTDAPVKHLDLSQNHLSSPLDFTNFTSLTELHLDDNELTTLPVFPKTLEKLYLKNNKFKGDLIFPENNITEVYLNENNGTTKCEDALANMKKDTSQDTNVKVINNTERKPGMYEFSRFCNWDTAVIQSATGHTATNMPELYERTSNQQPRSVEIDLADITTHSVELNNISKLETLDLAENGIRHLNGLKITETPIKELSLKHNLLYSDLDFSNFNSLSRLNLDDNNLTTLPVMPTTLKVLLLNNNHLNGSNVVFPKLKLKEVYLAGNRMAELPKNAFINLENVDTIDLRNSSFTTTSFHVTPSAIKNNLRIAVDTFVLPNVPQPRIEQNLNYNNTAEEKKHPSDLQNTVELQKHDNPYSDSICHILNGPKSPFCFD